MEETANIPKKRLRVLCLHGYGTSAEFMKFQMRSFISEFKEKLEFVFINGTYEIPLENINDERLILLVRNFLKEKKIYAWSLISQFAVNKPSGHKIDFLAQYSIETKNYILQTLKEKGPFDGILGFSQGGAMTHILAQYLMENKDKYAEISPKFYIFFASNRPHLRYWEPNYINIPSIHIIGKEDFLYERCLYMMTFYRNPEYIIHSEGHKIPNMSDEYAYKIRKFLEKIEQKDEKIVSVLPKL